MIQFFDELNLYDADGNFVSTASNPLPPGIQVSFYGGSTVTPASFSGVTGYIGLNGIVPVSLQTNQVYTAVFSGDQAPTVYGRFQTDSNGEAATAGIAPGLGGAPCSVIGYRSPSLSSLGYAIEQGNVWPDQWFSDAARKPGGTAFAVASGFGNVIGSADYMGQALLALMRLPTSTGAAFDLNLTFDGNGSFDSGIGYTDEEFINDALDSWAYDFFGPLWVRQPGMSSAQWAQLIQTILTTPKTTLAGIQQILTAWSPWFGSSVSTGASPSMGLDEFGGTDVTIPAPFGATPAFTDTAPALSGLSGRNIIVFDSQYAAYPNGAPLVSSATLNGYLSSSALVPGQICVYFQNPTAADSGLAPVSITNILINTIVQNWKASGVNYISSGVVHPCLYAAN